MSLILRMVLSWWRAAGVAVVLAALLSGCVAGGPAKARPRRAAAATATSTPSPSGDPGGSPGASVSAVPSPSPPPTWRVVALGDSVTSGGPCGCTPFPQLYGQDLDAVRGVQTRTANLGVGGETSGGLLAALDESSSPTARAVAAADIVLVTIGANDFADHHDDVTSGRCPGSSAPDCVADDLRTMEHNIGAIVARIHSLRGGQATAVLVTGYWNVFEDGAVARRSFPRIGVQATLRLTRLANAGIRQAAVAADATYVDLYAPFNGPASSGDTTRLLGPDGDHPNQAGQALIARRLVAAGLPGLVRG